jgi:hypothetical protein
MLLLQDEFQAERHELNEVVQRSKQLLTEKIEEFKWQKNEYDKLVAENQQLNCYKRNILMLEQEKRELESKLVLLGSSRRERTPEDDLGPDSDDLRSQVMMGQKFNKFLMKKSLWKLNFFQALNL